MSHFPDFSKEFVIHADAIKAGVGAFLAQNADDKSSTSDFRIIAYFNKRFTSKTLFGNDESMLRSCVGSTTLAAVYLG